MLCFVLVSHNSGIVFLFFWGSFVFSWLAGRIFDHGFMRNIKSIWTGLILSDTLQPVYPLRDHSTISTSPEREICDHLFWIPPQKETVYLLKFFVQKHYVYDFYYRCLCAILQILINETQLEMGKNIQHRVFYLCHNQCCKSMKKLLPHPHSLATSNLLNSPILYKWTNSFQILQNIHVYRVLCL